MFIQPREVSPHRVTRVVAAAVCSFASLSCAAAVCIVNSSSDDPADASAKVTSVSQTGWSGAHKNVATLRDCIVASNLMTGSKGMPTLPGMTIELAKVAGSVITLQDNLPLLFNNTAIVDTAGRPVEISGNAAHRIFFVSGMPLDRDRLVPEGPLPVEVTLSNLILEQGIAQGGDGAGGGMGAGGALFVNQNATVRIDDVTLSQNVASGGNAFILDTYSVLSGGGMGEGITAAAGGGGLNGPALFATGAGIGTPGTSQLAGGFGGTGIGQISIKQNFLATKFDVDTGNGTPGSLIGGGGLAGTTGKPGGFGGGGGSAGGAGGFGGGGAFASAMGAVGGMGGFGGGGGGVFFFGTGGNGGFGAGAGTTADFPTAAGVSGVGGGIPVELNVDAAFTGGGGAGFGGAIFVRAGGTLIVESTRPSDMESNTTVAGGYVLGSQTQTAAAVGDDMFVMSGARTTFDILSTVTIHDEIADDSLVSLPAGNSYVQGNGSGAKVVKSGPGTLVIDGTDARAGSMNVESGTLAGFGFILGPVTLASSARIKPGDPLVGGGIGTLSIGPLTWDAGGTMAYQLGVDDSTSDHLTVFGALAKQGTGPFLFDFGAGAAPPVAGQTYQLIAAGNTSAFTAQDFSFTHDASLQSLSGNFVVNPTGVYFVVTAVQP